MPSSFVVTVPAPSIPHECSSDTEAFSAEQLLAVDGIVARAHGTPGVLIAVLNSAQQVLGYLPTGIQLRIARGLCLPYAQVHGVVSFYSFFTQEPRGKHLIRVCFGTACFVKGARAVFDAFGRELGVPNGGRSSDGRFSLLAVRCLGACGLAPAVTIDDETFGDVCPGSIHELLGRLT